MRAAVAGFLFLLVGCGGDGGYPPQHLSTWGIFRDGAHQVPEDGVVPYDLISPLFSDYASKHRFIRLPEGETIAYSDSGVWQFPTGTAIIKTFGFLHDQRDPSLGERIVETRLLVLEDDGDWHPYVYLWNDATTDADLRPEGVRVPIETIMADGTTNSFEYRVPNTVQCGNCHGGGDPINPIGPRTEQVDRSFDYGSGMENQIDHMSSLGMFSGTVTPAASRTHLSSPFDTAAPLESRARAYLDANCAHCHRDRGASGQSGLWLGAHITDTLQLGFCKPPVAAGRGAGGRSYDVVPGMPDASIIPFRMASTEPGVKMPELPSVLSHAEGVALITEWIASLTPAGCP